MKANKSVIRHMGADDQAVSPVIAVILMVAITVVLAATVYVWVSGFGQQGNQAPSASFQVTCSNSGAPVVKLLSSSSTLNPKADLNFFTQNSAGASNTWDSTASTWPVGTTITLVNGTALVTGSYTLNVVDQKAATTIGSPNFNC